MVEIWPTTINADGLAEVKANGELLGGNTGRGALGDAEGEALGMADALADGL